MATVKHALLSIQSTIMDTSKSETMLERALFIDFNLYAENDPDFKEELIELMIENLRELQQAYARSVEQLDPELFRKACHKVNTTLTMLEDRDLNAAVEDLKNPEVDKSRVHVFNKLTDAIITGLSAEKSMPRKRTGTF